MAAIRRSSRIAEKIVIQHSGDKPSSRLLSTEQKEKLKVIHDKENQEFYIRVGGSKAYLQYCTLNEKTGSVDLEHTVVPEAFRGQGVAKILAKGAFDHFVSEKKQMKLTCWYLQKYIAENPLPQYMSNIID